MKEAYVARHMFCISFFCFLFSLMRLGIEFYVFKGFMIYLLSLPGWCFVLFCFFFSCR